MPHPLSHKFPIPTSLLNFHFFLQISHVVNIDVPAGLDAPPLDTTYYIFTVGTSKSILLCCHAHTLSLEGCAETVFVQLYPRLNFSKCASHNKGINLYKFCHKFIVDVIS